MAEPRIDTAEKECVGRGARSLPFGGGCALAIGTLMVAFSSLLALAVGLLLYTRPDAREQRWLGPPAALFMGLIGAGLVRVGLRDRRREARRKRMAALHPDEPWLADGTWDPEVTPAESDWDGKTLFIILFVLLVMAPFNVLWLSVFDPHLKREMRLFALMVLIPDFFMYLVARGVLSILRERLRFGRPYLRHYAFPFALGDALRARVTARRFAGQTGVGATLRCIDERMVRVTDGAGVTDSVRPYQLYEARWTFPGAFGGEDVPLALPLPADPPTELSRQPPRYWELEIAGDGPDDAVRFIVPVYSC